MQQNAGRWREHSGIDTLAAWQGVGAVGRDENYGARTPSCGMECPLTCVGVLQTSPHIALSRDPLQNLRSHLRVPP